jgi:NMD protein affecting ribosome stability and mRNA decay
MTAAGSALEELPRDSETDLAHCRHCSGVAIPAKWMRSHICAVVNCIRL